MNGCIQCLGGMVYSVALDPNAQFNNQDFPTQVPITFVVTPTVLAIGEDSGLMYQQPMWWGGS